MKDVKKRLSYLMVSTSVYWCNTYNDESSLINELDPEAVEIRGRL